MNHPTAPDHLRAMTDADIPAVSDLLGACFRFLAQRNGFNDRQLAFLLDRASEETVRLEAKHRPHVVACRGDRIAGVLVVNGNVIARLYVHPDFHRQGVGRALFHRAIEMIRAAGHREATVAALVPESEAFYEAMGMRPYGQQAYEPAIFTDRPITLLRLPL